MSDIEYRIYPPAPSEFTHQYWGPERRKYDIITGQQCRILSVDGDLATVETYGPSKVCTVRLSDLDKFDNNTRTE